MVIPLQNEESRQGKPPKKSTEAMDRRILKEWVGVEIELGMEMIFCWRVCRMGIAGVSIGKQLSTRKWTSQTRQDSPSHAACCSLNASVPDSSSTMIIAPQNELNILNISKYTNKSVSETETPLLGTGRSSRQIVPVLTAAEDWWEGAYRKPKHLSHLSHLDSFRKFKGSLKEG